MHVLVSFFQPNLREKVTRMAVVSKELLWRLRGVEHAFNTHLLKVWASIEGNPKEAGTVATDWGKMFFLAANPNNNVFNRASASGPGMIDNIERIEREYAARHVRPLLEVTAGDMDLDGKGGGRGLGELTARGFTVCDLEALFFGEIERSYALPSKDVEIVRVGSREEMEDFLEVYLDGWNYTGKDRDLWKEAGHGLRSDDRFKAYIAKVDGTPAGAGQLFLDDGIGYFADACVLKEHRRKGCQRALFAARHADAKAAGAELIFSIAEFASQSANNMEAFGLRMATELWHWRRETTKEVS